MLTTALWGRDWYGHWFTLDEMNHYWLSWDWNLGTPTLESSFLTTQITLSPRASLVHHKSIFILVNISIYHLKIFCFVIDHWWMKAKRYTVSLGRGDENVLELDSGDSCRLYEYTKHHWIVHFKEVNFMVRKLYLNKKLYEKKNRCVTKG